FALACLFVMPLSACLESDTAPSLDPKHLVIVPELQGYVRIKDGLFSLKQESGYRYTMSINILKLGTAGQDDNKEVSLIPLHTPDTPGENFLAVVVTPASGGEDARPKYEYFELKKEGTNFAVAPYLLSTDGKAVAEAKAIAASRG